MEVGNATQKQKEWRQETMDKCHNTIKQLAQFEGEVAIKLSEVLPKYGKNMFCLLSRLTASWPRKVVQNPANFPRSGEKRSVFGPQLKT